MIVAALLIPAEPSLANGHGSSSSAPPPPKQENLPPPARVVVTKKGPVLVNLNGMTLYYFERDDSGNKSTCDDKCTESWPPFAAPADAKATGDFTVITRADGSKMWAYRYRPLYTSQTDKTPGEANGFDSSNLWHLARPY
jgi:predicted lipoprotein with Yx(FWY)xxD motif